MDLDILATLRHERARDAVIVEGLRSLVTKRIAELEARQVPSARRAARIDEGRLLLAQIDAHTHHAPKD